MDQLIILFLLVVLTEATTQLVTKSTIFYKFREIIEKKSEFFGELFTCGYCFSVWASIFWNLVFHLLEISIILVDYWFINFFISVIVVHRLSNYLHGFSDRFLDTRKDIRYNQEE